jgi:hypothetical protein
VAEEFRSIFGMGDGTAISTVDTSGIAFAAIQGLNERLEATNAQLRLKINDQEERIKQLELALSQLLEQR